MASRSRGLLLALICYIGDHSWTDMSGSGTHFRREMVLQKIIKMARDTEHIVLHT